MAILSFSLVIVSGLIHALWNLFAKQSVNKMTFFWSVHFVSFIMLMPYFIKELPEIHLDGAAVLLLMGTMFFQVLYTLCMIIGYTAGELSLVYPILRGSASLLIPLISVIFLGDKLTLLGWIGLIIILTGICLVSRGDVKANNKKIKESILIAFCGGIAITGYTLSDKVLLEYVSPFAIFQFQNFIQVLALFWGALHSKSLKKEWIVNWRVILLGAIFVPGAYLTFLFALKLTQVAQLAPLREISIVFGAFLGAFFLQEPQGFRKIIGAIIIVLGIVILGLYG